MLLTIKKSFAASVLISLGVYGLLKTNYSPMSMVLFSFGLFVICKYELYLYTGRVGYAFEGDFFTTWNVMWLNLYSAIGVGFLFSENEEMMSAAISIASKWNVSFDYFFRSVMCGVIMFLAVDVYKRKQSAAAIFLGIPLFIMCGFQHCIANAVIVGVCRLEAPVLPWFLCMFGNSVGSIAMWFLTKEKK